jgi:hypothetical protein
MSADEPTRPALRIVRGSPTAEEIAAVAAVVTAVAAASTDTTPESPRGRWNDPAQMHRRPHLSGPGAWRAALR